MKKLTNDKVKPLKRLEKICGKWTFQNSMNIGNLEITLQVENRNVDLKKKLGNLGKYRNTILTQGMVAIYYI